MDVNRNDRAITGLVMLGHSLVHTYEFVLPVFIPIWLVQFSTTEFVVGSIVGVGMALFGLGAPLAGILTDRRGSKPLIVISMLGMGLSFVLLAVAGQFEGSGGESTPALVLITLALVLWGCAASLYHPAGLSLITRGVEARGSAFAYHGTAGNIGTAVGPFLATVLLFVLNDQWSLVAFILAVPALIGVALAVRIDVNETAAVTAVTDGGTTGINSLAEFNAESRRLLTGGFLVVFALVMCSGLYYRGMLTFMPEVLGGLSAIKPIELFGRTFEPANYLYTGLLAAGVGGQYVGGKLTDRISLERGLAGTFAVLAGLALVFEPVVAIGMSAIIPLLVAIGFVLFFVQPFYQATVAEYTPADTRGLSYGFTYLGVFGVGALGTPLAGIALTYFPEWALFVVLAVIACGAFGLAVYLAN